MFIRLKFKIKDLVNEILNQLPNWVWEKDYVTFLDPSFGGGQFLVEIERRLRDKGYSDENIRSRVFGFESNKLLVNYAINTHNLVSQCSVKTAEEFFAWEPNMKFDVVIGNPPYQDSDREDEANKLWPFFVKKADKLLNENGISAFITPNTWLNPTSDIKSEKFKIFSDIFKRKQLLFANTDSNFLKETYFPKVGSTFSWFIYRNSESSEPTKFITNTGIVEIDLKTISSLPKLVTKQSLGIIGKMVGKSFDFIDQNHSPSSEESREQTPIYQYPIFHTPAKGGTYWYCKKIREIAFKPKVIISLSGYYKPILLIDKAFSNMCIGLVCKTHQMAENAEIVLNSKLYRFWVEMNKFSGFNPRKTILSLPEIDISESWTDAEIYTHFNLSQEEVNYIEDTHNL